MGRIYTVVMASTTIANASGDYDWLEVSPADDKPVKLRGFSLSQTSEIKDAEEEILRFTVKRLPATVTSGTGGATPTPRSPDSAQSAAGFSAETNNSGVATSTGTVETLHEFGWNIRGAPYDFWYPDERFAPKAKQGEALVVRMESTVTDDITAMATFWLEEE